jgi:hypothetical protein
MVGRVSMATKAELVGAIGDRYRAGSRAERGKILDEFVAVTGYHRKHAIRLLRPKFGAWQNCRRSHGSRRALGLALLKSGTREDGR